MTPLKMTGFLTLLLMTFIANFSTASARTMAEALGYSPGDKLLIVHADDLGCSDSANEAAADLFRSGIVTSGSVMMSGFEVDGMRAFAEAHPEADLGVHLALTSEWSQLRGKAISPASEIASLVSGDGFFRTSTWLFLLGATPEHVGREIRAQVQAALSMGMNPSHIDTHEGSIFFRPSWMLEYLKLARDFKIPPMVPRWSEELKRNFFGTFGAPLIDALDGVGLFSVRERLQAVEDSGFLLLDHLYMFPSRVSSANDYDSRKSFYKRLLVDLKPGVTQVIIHPMYKGGRYGGMLFSNEDETCRDHEAYIFRDPEILAILQATGVRLITWREIQQAYDWSKVELSPETSSILRDNPVQSF